ncbi:Immediate early response gene 2 protein [Microtus ochrogaster]|uniref:Immediate early response gene 2 protein n=1 Tax=Microtus ochrogaster TaxID=79684 RepID=A0A8J6GYC9_MICOH|nr:Immediate early response gene 2 protein [Microtus ochrogaster]
MRPSDWAWRLGDVIRTILKGFGTLPPPELLAVYLISLVSEQHLLSHSIPGSPLRSRRASMEVQKEAQRIMTLSVWKMYHSRMQRGGLRLHRSLQLSLVMRSARELYLSAKVEPHQPEFPPPGRTLDPRLHPPREAEAAVRAAPPDAEQPPEPMDTQEEVLRVQETPALCDRSPARVSRKRRSSSDLSDGGDVGLVPSKKARLEEVEREETSEVADRLQLPPAQTEGAFPNLASVLQRRFSSLLNCGPAVPPPAPPACEAKPACRPADNMLSVLVRAVVAF